MNTDRPAEDESEDEVERLVDDSPAETNDREEDGHHEGVQIPSNEIVEPTDESLYGRSQSEVTDYRLWLVLDKKRYLVRSSLDAAKQDRAEYESAVENDDAVARSRNSDNEQCSSCAQENVSLPKKEIRGDIDFEIEVLFNKHDMKTNELLSRVIQIRCKSDSPLLLELFCNSSDKTAHPQEAILKLIHKDKFNSLEATSLEKNSPISPKLYSCGISDAHYLLLQEFIPGLPFDQLILNSRGELPALILLLICEQILVILSELYDLNLVHKDVKPENLIVRVRNRHTHADAVDFNWHEPFDETEWEIVIYIIDFGYTKSMRRPEEDDFNNGMGGTPEYMAPAQALYNHQQILADKERKCATALSETVKHTEKENDTVARKCDPVIDQSAGCPAIGGLVRTLGVLEPIEEYSEAAFAVNVSEPVHVVGAMNDESNVSNSEAAVNVDCDIHDSLDNAHKSQQSYDYSDNDDVTDHPLNRLSSELHCANATIVAPTTDNFVPKVDNKCDAAAFALVLHHLLYGKIFYAPEAGCDNQQWSFEQRLEFRVKSENAVFDKKSGTLLQSKFLDQIKEQREAIAKGNKESLFGWLFDYIYHLYVDGRFSDLKLCLAKARRASKSNPQAFRSTHWETPVETEVESHQVLDSTFGTLMRGIPSHIDPQLTD